MGTPPSLSAKEVLRELREGPENLGRRRSRRFREEIPRIREGEGSRRSEIMNPVNNDYWVVFAIRLRRGFHGVGHVMLAAGAGLDVIRVFGSFLEASDEVPSGHY